MLKGWRLPTECDRVLVKSHVEKPIITVGLPARKRLYVTKDQEVEFQAPPLLLVFQTASNTAKIFQYLEKKNSLYLKAYNIGNIETHYGDQICYGHGDAKPRCPKTANSLYWAIPFNSRGEIPLRYVNGGWVQSLDPTAFSKLENNNRDYLEKGARAQTSLLASKDYKASPHHEDVVVIVKQDSRIPDAYYRNGVAVGFGRMVKTKTLNVRFGKKFSLPIPLSEIAFA